MWSRRRSGGRSGEPAAGLEPATSALRERCTTCRAALALIEPMAGLETGDKAATCALGASRTRTARPLRPSPLPLGYEGGKLRAEDSNLHRPGQSRVCCRLHQLASPAGGGSDPAGRVQRSVSSARLGTAGGSAGHPASAGVRSPLRWLRPPEAATVLSSRSIVEWLRGVEPRSPPWQGGALTVVLQPRVTPRRARGRAGFGAAAGSRTPHPHGGSVALWPDELLPHGGASPVRGSNPVFRIESPVVYLPQPHGRCYRPPGRSCLPPESNGDPTGFSRVRCRLRQEGLVRPARPGWCLPVDLGGFEPPTPGLPNRCATAAPQAHLRPDPTSRTWCLLLGEQAGCRLPRSGRPGA